MNLRGEAKRRDRVPHVRMRLSKADLYCIVKFMDM